MNVPKLRFKEFTNEYKKVKFGDIVNYQKGFAFRSSDYKNNGIRVIRVSDTTNNSIKKDNAIYISEDEAKKHKSVELLTNDIIISSVGSKPPLYDSMVGKVILVPDFENGSLLNQNAIRFRAKIDNQIYLYHYLKQNKYIKFIESIMRGNANQRSITVEDLLNFQLVVPSLKEQIKVGNLLLLLDKKIELQTKKIEALKLFKLSITQNIFNEKKSNDFQSVTLGKILKTGSKIPVKNTSEYEKMTVKLNFKGLAKLETKKEMADTRPFYVRNENEIIIGKQNYFNGSIAKVTKDFKGCICSNAIMSFTTINGVNVDYVLYYLSQKNYINRRKFLANGTGQKELSEKEFLKFVIKLPSTQIQNNISKKISCVSNLLLLENKKLTTLKNLKKGLLQNLFI